MRTSVSFIFLRLQMRPLRVKCRLDLLTSEMTGCHVAGRTMFEQFRFFFRAFLNSYGTSWVEATASWGICGTWNVAFQNYASSMIGRVGNRDCHEESLSVWMKLLLEKLVSSTDLCDLSDIHDCYSIADVFDHAQVVRNEQVGQLQVGL